MQRPDWLEIFTCGKLKSFVLDEHLAELFSVLHLGTVYTLYRQQGHEGVGGVSEGGNYSNLHNLCVSLWTLLAQVGKTRSFVRLALAGSNASLMTIFSRAGQSLGHHRGVHGRAPPTPLSYARREQQRSCPGNLLAGPLIGHCHRAKRQPLSPLRLPG